MDHSPNRQTFELGKCASVAGKTIKIFLSCDVGFESIVKLRSCKVYQFCGDVHGKAFSRVIRKYTKG